MGRSYETAFIFSSTLDDAAIEQMMAKVEALVTKEGGTVEKWDRWTKRRLAFPIKRQTEGHYAFLTFQGEPSSIETLGAAYRLDEAILRHMTINLEE
ncbi:30S ribosomal protein S6 [bacterium]|nr:30S ribosomal protein S6 [bacterium]